MKKTILFLIFLLIPLPAYGFSAAIQAVLSAGGVVAGPSFCTGYSGLFCDDFEGSSTCGDDAASQANCKNTSAWSVVAGGSGGTVTNQATGLAGTYAKNLNATADASLSFNVRAAFTETSPVYAFFLFKMGTMNVASGSTHNFLNFVDSTTTSAAVGFMNDSGTMKFWALTTETNTTLTGAPTPTAGTTYCVWMSYTVSNESGFNASVAEATCSGGSCTCAKPAAQVTLATGTAAPDGIRIGAIERTGSIVDDDISVDNIKVSASAIGNNGE